MFLGAFTKMPLSQFVLIYETKKSHFFSYSEKKNKLFDVLAS